MTREMLEWLGKTQYETLRSERAASVTKQRQLETLETNQRQLEARVKELERESFAEQFRAFKLAAEKIDRNTEEGSEKLRELCGTFEELCDTLRNELDDQEIWMTRTRNELASLDQQRREESEERKAELADLIQGRLEPLITTHLKSKEEIPVEDFAINRSLRDAAISFKDAAKQSLNCDRDRTASFLMEILTLAALREAYDAAPTGDRREIKEIMTQTIGGHEKTVLQRGLFIVVFLKSLGSGAAITLCRNMRKTRSLASDAAADRDTLSTTGPRILEIAALEKHSMGHCLFDSVFRAIIEAIRDTDVAKFDSAVAAYRQICVKITERKNAAKAAEPAMVAGAATDKVRFGETYFIFPILRPGNSTLTQACRDLRLAHHPDKLKTGYTEFDFATLECCSLVFSPTHTGNRIEGRRAVTPSSLSKFVYL